MTRMLAAVDRMATLIMGVVLVAAALLVLSWRFEWWPHLNHASDTSSLTTTFDRDWWPWAVAGAGVVLIVVGLRWLVAHLLPRAVGELALPSSGIEGRSRFSSKAVATTAAEVLSEIPGVHGARGTARHDRGQLVIDLRVVIDPTADLSALAAAADQVTSDLSRVTARPDLYGRVHLVTSGKAPSRKPRVL